MKPIGYAINAFIFIMAQVFGVMYCAYELGGGYSIFLCIGLIIADIVAFVVYGLKDSL